MKDLSIAYAMKRKGPKKMAFGGLMGDDKKSPKDDMGSTSDLDFTPKNGLTKNFAEGGEVKNDIPEPNKKNAEEFSKGASESGYQPKQWMKNLKEGLHLYEGGIIDMSDSAPIEEAPMNDDFSDDFLEGHESPEDAEAEKKAKRHEMLASVIRKNRKD